MRTWTPAEREEIKYIHLGTQDTPARRAYRAAVRQEIEENEHDRAHP